MFTRSSLAIRPLRQATRLLAPSRGIAAHSASQPHHEPQLHASREAMQEPGVAGRRTLSAAQKQEIRAPADGTVNSLSEDPINLQMMGTDPRKMEVPKQPITQRCEQRVIEDLRVDY
jgi:hypothetical protein